MKANSRNDNELCQYNPIDMTLRTNVYEYLMITQIKTISRCFIQFERKRFEEKCERTLRNKNNIEIHKNDEI